MKKAIILFVCMGTMFCSIAQENPSGTSKPVLTKQEYLQKSKGQRTGAIVMVSAGGALAIAGLAVAVDEATNNIGNIFEPDKQTTKNETLSNVLFITGVAAMLGSIGLFVSAHRNKVKGLALSFKNEPANQLQRSMVRSVPSISLKIRI
jgi:hypothetical protein